MKPPRRVKVGPFTYDVVTDELAVRRAEVEGRADLLGQCRPEDATILIRPTQPPCVMRDSLLHEVLHAVNSMVGLGNELGEEQEERFVDRLTPALLSLLRDNSKLIAFLTEDP